MNGFYFQQKLAQVITFFFSNSEQKHRKRFIQTLFDH